MKLLTSLLVATTVYGCAPAQAQPASCGDYEKIKERLMNKYKETLIFSGLGGPNEHPVITQVFGNVGKTSFTVMIVSNTDTGLKACILQAGKDYQQYKPIDLDAEPV